MSRIDEALRRANEIAQDSVGSADASAHEPLRTVGHVWVDTPDVDEYRSEEETLLLASADLVGVETREPDGIRPQSNADGQRVKPAHEKLIVSDLARPIAVEQYRKLAATLHQVQGARETRIVMVVSAMAGEGKTLTAANLALTLSESFRQQVLLVDADLRRPTVHELFQISNASGLNDVLAADRDCKLPLTEVSPQLTILPAGRPNPDPMSGLTSDRMRRILEEASTKFEWVVVDTPPLGLLPDANLLARMVDMVVLVVGAGTTPFHLIQRAVKTMDRNRIVGVVLNRVVEAQAAYQYYDYYHRNSVSHT